MDTKSAVEEISSFLKQSVTRGARITIHRMMKRATYQRLEGELWLANKGDDDLEIVANTIYAHAVRDSKTSGGTTYKIQTLFLHQQWSKHFHLEGNDPFVRSACNDCNGAGWYVGLVEKRRCPTCGG